VLDIVKSKARKALPANYYLNLTRWWRHLLNVGFQHKCPICRKRVRAFLPFGVHLRPEAECPFCGSLERHRSLWLFLKNQTDLFSGKASILLHLSPEPCLQTKFSQLQDIHYVTADLDPTQASVPMDVQYIPFIYPIYPFETLALTIFCPPTFWSMY